MKRCRGGANFSCHCVTNGGFCGLPEGDACSLQEELNSEEESTTRKIVKTRKCYSGSEFLCKYKTGEGVCSLPSYEFCIMAMEDCTLCVGDYVAPNPPLVGVVPTKELKPKVLMGRRNKAPTVAMGRHVVIGSDDKNKIKICCDEIILTKDSVGITVDISVRDFDKFETIEINGRVFRRVRDENN